MATYTHPQGGQNFPWAAGGTAIGAGIAALMAKKKERLREDFDFNLIPNATGGLLDFSGVWHSDISGDITNFESILPKLKTTDQVFGQLRETYQKRFPNADPMELRKKIDYDIRLRDGKIIEGLRTELDRRGKTDVFNILPQRGEAGHESFMKWYRTLPPDMRVQLTASTEEGGLGWDPTEKGSDWGRIQGTGYSFSTKEALAIPALIAGGVSLKYGGKLLKHIPGVSKAVDKAKSVTKKTLGIGGETVKKLKPVSLGSIAKRLEAGEITAQQAKELAKQVGRTGPGYSVASPKGRVRKLGAKVAPFMVGGALGGIVGKAVGGETGQVVGELGGGIGGQLGFSKFAKKLTTDKTFRKKVITQLMKSPVGKKLATRLGISVAGIYIPEGISSVVGAVGAGLTAYEIYKFINSSS